jgi:uncharacterized protein
MTRDEALQLVREHVKNENLVKHMIAAGAVMRALARKFDGDEDKWELAGILHDMDWEETADDFKMHSVKAKEYLEDANVEPDIVNAVYVHNHTHGIEPQTDMEKALYCAEELTGLIVACALVTPDKQLKAVKVKSILKKFKQPSFAAGVDRELVLKCDDMLGMSLEELAELELNAMQEVAEELGL